MDNILVNIGKQLKRFRQKKGLSLKQVAKMSDVSTGLISKIENFRTTPSLQVLFKIMQSLEIDLTEFNLNLNNTRKYILIRNGEGEIEERDDSIGVDYIFLFSKNISESSLRTYLVKVKQDVYRKPISTDAFELIYVIDGVLDYTIEDEVLTLNEGDVLFFDGSTPHALRNNHKKQVILLKVYLINKN